MKDLLHRPLGVDALAAHDLGGARRKHRIVEHEELRVEERREIGPAAASDARADVGELLARPAAALFEAANLVGDARCGDLIAQHLRALDEDHGAARDNARGHADAG